MNYLSVFASPLSGNVAQFLPDSIATMAKLFLSNFAPGTSSSRMCTDFTSGKEERASSSSTRSTSRRTPSSGPSSGETCSSEFDGYEEEDEEDDAGEVVPKRLNLALEFRKVTYTVHHDDALCRECSARDRRDGSRSCRARNNLKGDEASKEVTVLSNISGKVQGGEMLVVMGARGSGKTALLDTLAQRVARGSVQGTVNLNGEEVQSNSIIRRISAYVTRDDPLFPMLTVKETLNFAADLRISDRFGEKRARVDEVLTQFDLTKVSDKTVGDGTSRTISKAERRRLSIGRKLLHNPMILFLDEATDGLDSAEELQIVSCLQWFSKSGSAIVLSMRQPSERILTLFTTLLFVSNGQIIYRGNPTVFRNYMEAYLGYTIPEKTTTAEYALSLVEEFTTTVGADISSLVKSFKVYSAQNEYRAIFGNAAEFYDASDKPSGDPESLQQTQFGIRGALAAGLVRGKLIGQQAYVKHLNDDDIDIILPKFAKSRTFEVTVLARRGALNLTRTPELCVKRFVFVVISAILLATVFWQLDTSPLGLQGRLGFFAFAVATSFYACTDSLPILLQERDVMMHEIAHDSYRLSSYILATSLANVTFLFLLALPFSVATFWPVGLSGGLTGFSFFLIVIWTCFWAGNSFTTLLSALISNLITGYAVALSVLGFLLVFSGFFFGWNGMPPYWRWLHYVSILKYPYEALLLSEFGKSDSKCYQTADQILIGTPFQDSDAVTDLVLQTIRPLLLSSTYRDITRTTCLKTGSAVLRDQHVGEISKWICVAVTVGFGLLVRLLFYIVLRCSGRRSRRSTSPVMRKG